MIEVVFDPPHLHKLGQDAWMAQKYGVLLPSWEEDIKEGFNEAMRVLQPFGTLIFKWNEVQITTRKVLQIMGITFCGFVSGCEALALSGRAACTKPLLCAVFGLEF